MAGTCSRSATASFALIPARFNPTFWAAATPTRLTPAFGSGIASSWFVRSVTACTTEAFSAVLRSAVLRAE